MPCLYRATMSLALASHLNQALRHTQSLTASIDDRRLRRAVAYIRDNLSQDISLDALAWKVTRMVMTRTHEIGDRGLVDRAAQRAGKGR